MVAPADWLKPQISRGAWQKGTGNDVQALEVYSPRIWSSLAVRLAFTAWVQFDASPSSAPPSRPTVTGRWAEHWLVVRVGSQAIALASSSAYCWRSVAQSVEDATHRSRPSEHGHGDGEKCAGKGLHEWQDGRSLKM